MSGFGDDEGDMTDSPISRPLDDDAIEALLAGAVDPDPVLASLIADARLAGRGPEPVPSPALARLFEAGAALEADPMSDKMHDRRGTKWSDHEHRGSEWRSPMRKVTQLVGGLSFAGKLLLGVGVCAAATGGAGAAGVLPAPVQHAIHDVVPFVPSPHDEPGASGTGAGTGNEPTTTIAPGAGDEQTPTTVVTPTTKPEHEAPTTEAPTTVAPTPTTQPARSGGDGSGSDSGSGNGGATDGTTPPPASGGGTSDGNGDGDNTPPAGPPITLSCAVSGGAVVCDWSAVSLPAGDFYALLRTGDGQGRAFFPSQSGGTQATDTLAQPGITYTYMVVVSDPSTHKNYTRSNQVQVTITPPATTTTTAAPSGSDG
jgi:hypothetical protein